MNFNEIVDEILKKYSFTGFPVKYKERLVDVCEKAYSIFKSNLQSITLGGSGGKNNLIEEWSDLDIYIILYKYDQEKIKDFYLIDSDDDIHVGTTFYTVKEIENSQIDGKTIIMIYEKFAYNVNPTLFGKNIFVRKNFVDVLMNDNSNLYNVLQLVRRICLDIRIGKMNLSKNHIKKLLVLLKCILSQHGTFAYGYDVVFELFEKLYYKKTGSSINIKTGFDIKQVVRNIENLSDFNNQYIEYCMLVNDFIISEE